ncbi:MAG: hypothetical protein MI861_23505 [Pirellulales bacterium]|nr:hypothetical protein [Pirellulales bacterium]
MKRIVLVLIVSSLWLASPPQVDAVPAASVGSSIAKALLKYLGKDGAAEYLTKKGGQEVLERVGKNAAKQGGDEAVEQVSKLASKHGPEALAALDNSPSIMPVIQALDEIPESQVQSALTRLAAGKPGRELAQTVSEYGAIALRSELKHPGVGMVLVRNLGDDGAELAAKLTTDQAITVGRHADDLAKLPLPQRSGVLGMLKNDTNRMVAFAGRFVEQNPGKTLFTVATTAVILAEPDRILGGDQIVFDAEGNPVLVSKSGLVGRTMEAGGEAAAHVSNQYLRPLFMTAMVFLGTFVALWMMIKLWQVYRGSKTPVQAAAEDEVLPS